jgi:hypothetical protein
MLSLRCQSCDDLIGVYEPLVRVIDGHAHESSRLREPQLTGREGDCFHRACFQRLDRDERIADAPSGESLRRSAP